MYRYFTSESVAAGHPDKICDQISDSIVDACLKADKFSRVAVETLVTTNRVVIAGEVTCSGRIAYKTIARQKIKELGYDSDLYNFSYQSPISLYVHQQSPDIAVGVDDGGAGDQGMMFGFASNETPELMPMPIMLAHSLVKTMDSLRENQKLAYLRPDGKAEVVVEYDGNIPVDVVALVLAVPYDTNISKEQLRADLIKLVITPTLNKYLADRKTKLPKITINGTGAWEIGGPNADTGVTGRKIIVDTYGGMGRHGGGCFSGKDASKVDRSGAYACRFLAKNIVAAKLADKCEVKVAYVIGEKDPISMDFETFGTEKKSKKIIQSFAKGILDFSVPNIISKLNLRRPIYSQTARYGHFGNNKYPWEKIYI